MIHPLLDYQHAGRPDKPADMGASYDLDSDGIRGENGEREVDLTRIYGAHCQDALVAAGHTFSPITTGTYDARHRLAIDIAKAHDGPVPYGALHVNSGGGTYGLVRYDHRSAGGKRLAEAIAMEFAVALPELSQVRVEPLYPDAATAKRAGKKPHVRADGTEDWGWWTRGWVCIRGVYAGPANLSGVLVEPGFGDSAAHRGLWTEAGLKRIGEALAGGMVRWGGE